MAAPASSLVGSLPIVRTPLIGREAERAMARSLLLDDAAPLLTLTGPGGVGKTRLALAVAQELAEHFADGVVVVELAPLAEPALVPFVIAHAVSLTETTETSLPEQLHTALHPRQMLLVLDNCEHLLPAVVALAAPLLMACPALQIIATSRAPLRVRGEHELPVSPLSLPPSWTITGRLEEAPAIQLFVARARAAQPDFSLTAGNVSAVIDLCRRLDGLPLAIELAAAWSKVLTPSAMLARLEHHLLDLTGGPRDLPARQQTLRATLAWSYRLLPAAAQALLRALSVCAGGFSLATAAALGAREAASPAALLGDLATLLDHSLVTRIPSDEIEPRYRMLETVREFGQEQLRGSGEERQARQAHAAYFLALAEEADALLRGPHQQIWLDRLDLEHDNLRAAMAWEIEDGRASEALRLVGALGRFWDFRGHHSEGLRWLPRALALSDAAAAPERARALDAAGMLALAQGHLRQATEYFEEAAALYHAQQDQRGMADSLEHRAMVAYNRGDYQQAGALLEESLPLRREFGDAWELGWVLDALGAVARTNHDLDRATVLVEEALALARQIDDPRQIASSLHTLAWIAKTAVDYRRAKAFLDEALGLYQGLDDRKGVADTLCQLAAVASYQGDDAAAERLLTTAHDVFRELGAQSGMAETLRALGWIAHDRGDYAAAASLFEDALARHKRLDDTLSIADSLAGLGAAARELGDFPRAATLAEEALAHYQDLGATFEAAETLIDLGEIARARGDLEQAAARVAAALRLLRQLGYQPSIVRALESLAATAAHDRHMEIAARLLGATQTLRARLELLPRAAEAADLAATQGLIRSHLDDQAHAAATAAGRAAPIETLLAEALQLPGQITSRSLPQHASPDPPSGAARTRRQDPFGLTERELEVLTLLCQRLTNKEIAATLFVGPRTVQTHTISIFTKLGVDNRRDAAARALAHGLA